MIREGVALGIHHFQEHYALYVGFTLAFTGYFIYQYALRIKYFSPMRNYPGPEHGHWFLGQLKAITIEGPGIAQQRWHRQVCKRM